VRYRKKTEGFNLAFLDIMSCGLGAVILIFMLVKQQVNDSSVELEHLKDDIQNLQNKNAQAQSSLKKLRAQKIQESAQIETAKKQLAIQQAQLKQQNSESINTQQSIAELKSEIKGIKIPENVDLLETEQINEENYLLGLKVEGKKIVVLVDSSASMTHNKLIDIIKMKTNSQQKKKTSPKWQRTKRVVKWLLARLPKDSDIVVISFNETARLVGATQAKKAKDKGLIGKILSDLNSIVPTGATNLQQGLSLANKYNPSNIYVITDGLPTKGNGNYKSLNPFSSCSSLTANSKTISGACRVKLFQQTMIESGLKGAKVDVVLLPLEGDPDAINQYWTWTTATGGLVISPASDWP